MAYCQVHGIPNSELQIISKAGHMSMQENPEEVNSGIKEFLDKN